jgi:hypothetical protein
MFNLSMTFRMDSDILFTYGSAVDAKLPGGDESAIEAQIEDWYRSKSRLAGWTVSHCYTASRREEYVKQLRKFIPLDVYGKCSGLWGILGGAGHERHAHLIRDKYKFYLAFENRLCKDYITEKFWVDALMNGAIPVVRGGMHDSDYAMQAPPGSYINADWFDSPRELGAYLQVVAANYTLYRSYHAWRLTHQLTVHDVHWHRNQVAERRAMCFLCAWLHGNQHALPEMKLNLTRFWDGSTQCRPPLDVAPQSLLDNQNKHMDLAWQGR